MIERQEAIGTATLNLLDRIEAEYGEGRNPVLKQVLVAAEIEYDDDEGDRSSHVMLDYDEARPVVRAGLYLYLGKAMGLTP